LEAVGKRRFLCYNEIQISKKEGRALETAAKQDRPIGVFDSGLGGISVLAALRRALPGEHFIYYGDAANAPYGDRSQEEVRALTLQACAHLAARNIKALVVACNTATGASVADLRETYAFPVIGMEPALKPAAQVPGSRVLVLATRRTLEQEKFLQLLRQWGNGVKVIPLPAVGLVEKIESGGPEDPGILPYLQALLAPYVGRVDALVLGCTHYPFVLPQIRQVLGDVPVFDGRAGTARQLKRRLEEEHLLRRSGTGSVTLESSAEQALPLAQTLLAREEQEETDEV
jgi:glutamate racemase